MLFQWDLWNCIIFICIKHYTGLVGCWPFEGHERVWDKERKGGCNGPLFVHHQFSRCSPWYAAWQDTKIQRRLVVAVQDPRWAGGTGHGTGAPSHRLHTPTPHQPPHLRHRCPATWRHPGWDAELVPLTVLKSACWVCQREREREQCVSLCSPECLQCVLSLSERGRGREREQCVSLCSPECLQCVLSLSERGREREQCVSLCSPECLQCVLSLSERGCVVCVCQCVPLCVLLSLSERGCVVCVCQCVPLCVLLSLSERGCVVCVCQCVPLCVLPNLGYDLRPQCVLGPPEWDRVCVAFVGLCAILPFTWGHSVCLVHQSETECVLHLLVRVWSYLSPEATVCAWSTRVRQSGCCICWSVCDPTFHLRPQCVLGPPEWDRVGVAFVGLCVILPFTWGHSVCLVHQSETEWVLHLLVCVWSYLSPEATVCAWSTRVRQSGCCICWSVCDPTFHLRPQCVLGPPEWDRVGVAFVGPCAILPFTWGHSVCLVHQSETEWVLHLLVRVRSYLSPEATVCAWSTRVRQSGCCICWSVCDPTFHLRPQCVLGPPEWDRVGVAFVGPCVILPFTWGHSVCLVHQSETECVLHLLVCVWSYLSPEATVCAWSTRVRQSGCCICWSVCDPTFHLRPQCVLGPPEWDRVGVAFVGPCAILPFTWGHSVCLVHQSETEWVLHLLVRVRSYLSPEATVCAWSTRVRQSGCCICWSVCDPTFHLRPQCVFGPPEWDRVGVAFVGPCAILPFTWGHSVCLVHQSETEWVLHLLVRVRSYLSPEATVCAWSTRVRQSGCCICWSVCDPTFHLRPQCVLGPPEWDRVGVAFVGPCAILPFTWGHSVCLVHQSETECVLHLLVRVWSYLSPEATVCAWSTRVRQSVCCICWSVCDPTFHLMPQCVLGPPEWDRVGVAFVGPCAVLPFTWGHSVCLVHQNETERGCVVFVGLCVIVNLYHWPDVMACAEWVKARQREGVSWLFVSGCDDEFVPLTWCDSVCVYVCRRVCVCLCVFHCMQVDWCHIASRRFSM